VIVVIVLPGEIRVFHCADAFGALGFDVVDDGAQRAGAKSAQWDQLRYVRRDVPPGRLYGGGWCRFIPRINGNDHVYVVWHHNPIIDCGIGSYGCGALDFIGNNASDVIQSHDVITDFAEPRHVVLCADGDEIPARCRVIPPGLAVGRDAILFLIQIHAFIVPSCYPLCSR
jgi:hypothetical protein